MMTSDIWTKHYPRLKAKKQNIVQSPDHELLSYRRLNSTFIVMLH